MLPLLLLLFFGLGQAGKVVELEPPRLVLAQRLALHWAIEAHTVRLRERDGRAVSAGSSHARCGGRSLSLEFGQVLERHCWPGQARVRAGSGLATAAIQVHSVRPI